ncbi:hypothetical protein E2C01_054662 [Portunus trituberculatus]|uniref:Uncharacterized protein n=1 Tax=Portunus trituberculatus TaxID=210409 RepID=A0A5B7GSL5_PORTR|nr:hypothetical protein [Portunus trituberculatus]
MYCTDGRELLMCHETDTPSRPLTAARGTPQHTPPLHLPRRPPTGTATTQPYINRHRGQW